MVGLLTVRKGKPRHGTETTEKSNVKMRTPGWPILALLLATNSQLIADILYSVSDLGTLGGDSTATGINNAGQVTGTSAFHAFLYSNGQMMDLGTLGGPGSNGNAINNGGQVVGVADTANSPPHAFLYSNGQMIDLGTLPGDLFSRANGINDAGLVTGTSYVSNRGGPVHAFLYSNGQMMDLGTLGGNISSGTGINDAAQVTGGSETSTGASHAFLYSNGQMMDLGTLGGPNSIANGINDAGQVVGTSFGTFPGTFASHAFLYSNGQMMDLNGLIDPTLGITLTNATAINDNGQIAANAASNFGSGRAYLLTPSATPVPEPSTLALFGAALLTLVAWTRK